MRQTEIASENIETLEGDKIISDFMGWESEYHPVEQIHSSWDWLMPAWFKFQEEYNRGLFCNTIINSLFWGLFKEGLLNGDILTCHKALVQGIEWLNRSR